MSEIERLREDLQRALDGDPWHGPSVKALLKGVDAHVAARHPMPGLHSIWENVLHMTAWAREVARRLRGHAIEQPAAGDWPAVGDPSDARWTAACADLSAAHQELEAALIALGEQRLDEPVGVTRDAPLGAGYSFAVMVSGVAQHDAYHGGQIAILKKVSQSFAS